MWEGESYWTKLRILEGASTVMASLLMENAELVQMIKRGDSQEACLKFINENW